MKDLSSSSNVNEPSAFNRSFRALPLMLLVWGVMLAFGDVNAALPAAPTAPGGAAGSDFIDFFEGYAGNAISTIILIVGALIFVVVAWLAIQALIEATNGRGSWATVIVLGLAGAAVIVFDLVLLNQANLVFDAVT